MHWKGISPLFNKPLFVCHYSREIHAEDEPIVIQNSFCLKWAQRQHREHTRVHPRVNEIELLHMRTKLYVERECLGKGYILGKKESKGFFNSLVATRDSACNWKWVKTQCCNRSVVISLNNSDSIKLINLNIL